MSVMIFIKDKIGRLLRCSYFTERCLEFFKVRLGLYFLVIEKAFQLLLLVLANYQGKHFEIVT
jgi:hypothetical protein